MKLISEIKFWNTVLGNPIGYDENGCILVIISNLTKAHESDNPRYMIQCYDSYGTLKCNDTIYGSNEKCKAVVEQEVLSYNRKIKISGILGEIEKDDTSL